MSDLISRSELLEIIKGSQELLDFQKDECIACINSCDIAYDIDKVVSEIRRASGNGYRDIDGDYVPPMIETKEAIEIVKHGGVSDDVCEYENTDDEYCKWKINSVFPETINNPHVAERENISTAKYCPCCGKKIKVVK